MDSFKGISRFIPKRQLPKNQQVWGYCSVRASGKSSLKCPWPDFQPATCFWPLAVSSQQQNRCRNTHLLHWSPVPCSPSPLFTHFLQEHFLNAFATKQVQELLYWPEPQKINKHSAVFQQKVPSNVRTPAASGREEPSGPGTQSERARFRSGLERRLLVGEPEAQGRLAEEHRDLLLLLARRRARACGARGAQHGTRLFLVFFLRRGGGSLPAFNATATTRGKQEEKEEPPKKGGVQQFRARRILTPKGNWLAGWLPTMVVLGSHN